jgi:Tfp pilus assembly protein PilF
MPKQMLTADLPRSNRVDHKFFALLCLAACLGGIWTSGRIGLARMLALYGVTTNMLPALQEAVQLSPTDPEVHYARARALLNAGQLTAAIPDLERTVALQSRNFGFWIELGQIYDGAGKSEAALAAVTKASQLAPYYAQPHWLLGNLLLRAGRRQEAFAEFRLAVNSDSTLVPNAVDLAWGAFDGNPQAIEQALQPRTATTQMELAKVFAARGAVSEAVRLFHSAAQGAAQTPKEQENLVTELLQAKRYYEARKVWAVGRESEQGTGLAAITDGGFEKEVSVTEAGFGWRINQSKPTVTISLDAQEPFREANSLKIQWEGKSWSSVLLASQIVLVEPKKTYQLNFAVRTKDIVSGGLPEVVVLKDFEGALLASTPIAEGTQRWRANSLVFVAPPESQTVVIAIRRKACTSMPCPAFGNAWFDAFSLQASN